MGLCCMACIKNDTSQPRAVAIPHLVESMLRFFPCRVRYLLVAGSCDLFHVTIMALDRYYFMNSPLSYEFKAPSWIEFGLPCTWVSSYIVLAYMAEGTCKFEASQLENIITILNIILSMLFVVNIASLLIIDCSAVLCS